MTVPEWWACYDQQAATYEAARGALRTPPSRPRSTVGTISAQDREEFRAWMRREAEAEAKRGAQ